MVVLLPLCWLAMMAVHECGHACAAWSTGGAVRQVVLHPLAISRTDVRPNPHPLWVAWAGPVVGVALPCFAWLAAMAMRLNFAYLLRFFAGFCAVANGAYIAGGSFQAIGDAGEMLRHGTPRFALLAFGAGAVILGFAIWHKSGPKLGWGPGAEVVPRSHIVSCTLLLLALIALELALSAQQ